MRVSRSTFEALSGQKKPNKYNARRTVYDSESYDSSAEAYRASVLDLLVKAGKILKWERGERNLIVDGGVGRRVWFKPDFKVYPLEGSPWVEDVKGQDRKIGKAIVTQGFRIKAILWALRYPDLPLRVVNKEGVETWKLK